jgi:hypothetical protein
MDYSTRGLTVSALTVGLIAGMVMAMYAMLASSTFLHQGLGVDLLEWPLVHLGWGVEPPQKGVRDGAPALIASLFHLAPLHGVSVILNFWAP